MLDNPGISQELLFRNLRELDIFNRVSGGHAISLAGIKKLVTDRNKIYHLVDLGCGGGALMRTVADWAERNGYQVKLTGVDRNPLVISYLNRYNHSYKGIEGVVGDSHDFLKSGREIDIIHCSLFCHHLMDNELAELLRFCRTSAKTGFVINDLHRHWLAYWGVIMITYLLNGSALSKNDGPVSVMRAFRREELISMITKAGIKHFSINWKWAFRYLVVGYYK